jgi:excisionase family DNA binding protein
MWNGQAWDQKLLTKGEVASLCRVEIRTVDRWVASGKLRHYRTPSGRLLFHEADVLVMANRSPQVAQADLAQTDLAQTDL